MMLYFPVELPFYCLPRDLLIISALIRDGHVVRASRTRVSLISYDCAPVISIEYELSIITKNNGRSKYKAFREIKRGNRMMAFDYQTVFSAAGFSSSSLMYALSYRTREIPLISIRSNQ